MVKLLQFKIKFIAIILYYYNDRSLLSQKIMYLSINRVRS